MIFKRVLGSLMLLAFFGLLCCAMIMILGIKLALIVSMAVIVTVIFIWIAAWLLTS